MDARIPSPPRLRRATASLGRRSLSEGGKSGHDGRLHRHLDRHTSAIPRRRSPEFLKIMALEIGGRRESRMLAAPAAPRAGNESTQINSPQVRPERSGFPRAIGFNGFLRALLGDRAFLSPSLARSISQA